MYSCLHFGVIDLYVHSSCLTCLLPNMCVYVHAFFWVLDPLKVSVFFGNLLYLRTLWKHLRNSIGKHIGSMLCYWRVWTGNFCDVQVFVLQRQLLIFSLGGSLPDQPTVDSSVSTPVHCRATTAGLDVIVPKPGNEITLGWLNITY